MHYKILVFPVFGNSRKKYPYDFINLLAFFAINKYSALAKSRTDIRGIKDMFLDSMRELITARSAMT